MPRWSPNRNVALIRNWRLQEDDAARPSLTRIMDKDAWVRRQHLSWDNPSGDE